MDGDRTAQADVERGDGQSVGGGGRRWSDTGDGKAGSVRRYLDIVEDGLCTCDRSLIRNGFCWHQLAARIAVLAGLCEEYDLWYHAALE